MKRIFAIAIVVAGTFLNTVYASAQDHLAKVTVPFAFQIGNAQIPAGTYQLSSSLSAPTVMQIDSWEKNVHVFGLGRPDPQYQRVRNSMVFHRYGGQYFLSDIRSENGALSLHFPATKAERRAKAETDEAKLVTDPSVLIALR